MIAKGRSNSCASLLCGERLLKKKGPFGMRRFNAALFYVFRPERESGDESPQSKKASASEKGSAEFNFAQRGNTVLIWTAAPLRPSCFLSFVQRAGTKTKAAEKRCTPSP
jgi:hypothetical protein